MDLYGLDRNASYLDMACRIADAVLQQKTSEAGILLESCDPSDCGADGEQFKGVFVRYLGYLAEALPDSYEAQRRRYIAFVSKNAESVWSCSRGADGQVRESWMCLASPADTTTHASGLDSLNADLLLNGASAAYLQVGFGNCAPNRPQWYGLSISFRDCRGACSDSEHCIGFDWDRGGEQHCRIRFAINAEAASAPAGFSFESGDEGDDIYCAGGSASAICYKRAISSGVLV